jgi:steroid 5-alpha reductase family enzyme
MSSIVTSLLVGTIAVAVVMTALWRLGLRHRNFSYVDIGWCANFVVLAIVCGVLGEGWAPRRYLIATLFAVWGARLALHLAQRIIGEPEEGRYTELRRRWSAGGRLNLKFLLFFQFQAVLNLVLSVPLLLACQNATPQWHVLELAGAALWTIGWLGESIADRQLAAFKRNPDNRGEVCEVGLWRYSRHPNYFFEWVIWVGYALFALPAPWGPLALLTPALMLHFLLNVTGVKATEAQALRSKGESYRRYQRRTSVFVPLPRRAIPEQETE